MGLDRQILLPFVLLIGLQILDVAVHVATQQIEPIRITSNVIIAAGAAIGVFGTGAVAGRASIASSAVYLALNVVFLVQHGLVNPTTEALRLPLFVFVIGSLALMNWLRLRLQNRGAA